MVSDLRTSELAKKEDLIREHLIKQYNTDDLLKWLLDLLKNTIQKQHVLLREDSTYTDVLKKYIAK
jgi:hypothetical protein